MNEYLDTKIDKNNLEMCECGRLYKDRIDQNGKMICVACYTGLDLESLKKLWTFPIKDGIWKK